MTGTQLCVWFDGAQVPGFGTAAPARSVMCSAHDQRSRTGRGVIDRPLLRRLRGSWTEEVIREVAHVGSTFSAMLALRSFNGTSRGNIGFFVFWKFSWNAVSVFTFVKKNEITAVWNQTGIGSRVERFTATNIEISLYRSRSVWFHFVKYQPVNVSSSPGSRGKCHPS